MLRKLKTFRSGSKNFEPPNEPTPKQEVDPRLKDLLAADVNIIESLDTLQPDHKHRNVKSPLNLEEFEKEVDISERAKNFNFRFDEDDDGSLCKENKYTVDLKIVASSMNSQRIDMVEGDEQLNLKGGDMSSDRNTSSIASSLQNDRQNKEEPKEESASHKRRSDRIATVRESLLGPAKKPVKSIDALEEAEMSSYVERTFDDSHDGIDAKYRDDAQYSKYKWIIFPDDSLRYIWDITIALNLLYTATIVPYSVSFMDDPGPVLNVFEILSDVIWALDIVITFNSAYEDKEDNLIVSRKKIAINYFTGWFLLDFVSILPFDLMFNMDKSFNSLLRIAKLPKLARFVRLAKLVRMLRFLKQGSKAARGISDWLKFRPGMDRFFMTIAFFFMFCHLACCVWYLQATMNSDDDTNWLARNNLEQDEQFAQYISSFYFIIATIVTVGYGDIHAGNTLERIVAVFLMFLGAFFYSFIIGSLSSVILNLDSKHRDLEKKINTLIEIRQKYALDNVMFNKIKRALKFGYSRNEEDNIHFLNDLPLPLRTKLSVVMHKDILKNIIFFKPKSDRFLATIGPLLKPMKIGINEYIFTEGEYANEMYFIKSGTVQMVIKEYNNFPFMIVEQGYYFGEVDLLFGETRKHSYQAKSECELLTLSKKNFTKVFFQDFPDVGAEIYNNALKRRVRAHKTYKEALAQCQNEAKEKGKRRMTTKFVPQVTNIHAKIDNLEDSDGDGEGDTSKNETNEAHQEEKGSTSVENRLGKEESNPLPADKSESNSTVPKTIEMKPETLSGEIHEEAHSIAKAELEGGVGPGSVKPESESSLFKGMKKPMGGRWSLLRNTFESKIGSPALGPEKKIDIGGVNSRGSLSFLHSEPAAQQMNSDQVHLLQQRVDQLEKSIEKILELYQSVIPKDDE